MKRSPKRLAADFLQAAGFLAAARTTRLAFLRRPALVILCYHRIAPDSPAFSPLCLHPADFERQILALARGRDIWPLRRVGDWHAGRDRLRRDTLVVTFDDGYADNHRHAAPVLERLGVPATFFVTTGPLAAGGGFWWDEIGARLDGCADPRALEDVQAETRMRELLRAYVAAPAGRRRAAAAEVLSILKWADEEERARLLRSLRERLPAPGDGTGNPLMTPAQVADLARRGFEVGGHGVTHTAFSTLGPAGRRAETRGCRDHLRALGIDPTSFAYPYGDAGGAGDARGAGGGGGGEDAVRAVAEAGFALAVTTDERVATTADGPLLLPRKVIAPQSTGQVSTRLERLAWR